MVCRRATKLCKTDRDFALNLFKSIFGYSEIGMEEGMADDCNVNGVLQGFASLPDNCQRILRYCLYDCLTQSQISEIESVSETRISQIWNQSLRLLRHPLWLRKMSISKMEKSLAWYQNKVFQLLGESARDENGGPKIPITDLGVSEKPQLPIRELGLSVRSENILIRNSIKNDSLRYVEGLLSMENVNALAKVNNMGIKSLREIIKKMKEIGFVAWADKMESEIKGLRNLAKYK